MYKKYFCHNTRFKAHIIIYYWYFTNNKISNINTLTKARTIFEFIFITFIRYFYLSIDKYAL